MKNATWKIKLGVGLVLVSIPLFLILPVLPFIDFEAEVKVKLGTVIFILAEVFFWVGGLLLGKELFAKYKAYFNPKNWFKNKAIDSDSPPNNSDER